MRKFIINSILFLLLFPLVSYTVPLLLLYTNVYLSAALGKETYHSILKSKQKKQTKKILIGDSVAWQMFPNDVNNDTINSLASNQAIGLVGQYILLNNYINAGNKINAVYMLFTPFSLNNNLDQIFTYQYFLKPFYKEEYLPLFSMTVKKQIDKIPFVNINQHPLILTSNWAPDFVSKDTINHTFLSPISAEYLIKIRELSVRHNFQLVLLSPPINSSEKDAIAKIDITEIEKNNLSEEFKNYFENIIYLNDSNFTDGMHLKYPPLYAEYFKNQFMK